MLIHLFGAGLPKFTIVLSDVTIGELEKAPELVRELPTTIPSDFLELVSITDQQLELADKYFQEGALTEKFHSDAQHTAISSILKVDSLVSWNFKHIFSYQTIQFNKFKIWLFNH